MRYLKTLVPAAAALAIAVFGLGGISVPANAFPAGVCPTVGNNTDCQVGITLNPGGTGTIVGGLNTGTYDGVEDTLVGIVNSSGGLVLNVALSGSGIFGFDGDGLCTFINCGGSFSGTASDPLGGQPNIGTGWADPTSYGGPGVSFTVINANSGIVHFAGGLADGATAYFSLEEPLTAASFTVTQVNVPEPASIALIGLGLAGFGFMRRKRAA